uniref:Uncharacterized protein n=1 Tax=Chlorobium chlorochromatii (strain CaD3) TaxID=340177 RepID=Q3ASC4_CHLCH
MKTEVKIALIGGTVTIIAAVLPIVLGWYEPNKQHGEAPPPPSQTAPAWGSATPVLSSSNSPASEPTDETSRLQALATIIRNRDVDAAKASPQFQCFVKEHYGKELDAVSRRELPAFWVKMAKSLAAERRAAKDAATK